MEGPRVRGATADDVEDLVRLRIENGRVHEALDATVYRVPDEQAVRSHFRSAVSARRGLIAVAEDSGGIVGAVEVVPTPAPPEHQILRPQSSAQIHTVVLPSSRGRGVGRALIAAAEEWAQAHGVVRLVAGIQYGNAPAERFYAASGYRRNGVVRIKDLPVASL